MANPFLEGYYAMGGEIRADNQAKDMRREADIAARQAEFNLGQDNVEAVNRERTRAAVIARDGDIAADPTFRSTAENARAVGQRNDRSIVEYEQADQDRARGQLTGAITAAGNIYRKGKPLAPQAAQALGLTPEQNAEFARMGVEDPEGFETLMRGLLENPQPDLQTAVSNETDKPVFGGLDPVTGEEVILSTIRPTDRAVTAGSGGGGSSGRLYEVGTGSGVFRSNTAFGYFDVNGQPLDVETAQSMIAGGNTIVEGSKTGAREGAKNDVEIIRAAPAVRQSASNVEFAIDRVLGDPNLDAVIGSPTFDKFLASGGTGALGFEWPGTAAANAAANIEYVNSTAFKEAFETLKGGGPITEKEGDAATKAYTDLVRSRSGPAFRAAMRVFRARVSDMVTAKEQALAAAEERVARNQGTRGPVADQSVFSPEVQRALDKYPARN